MNYVFMFNSQDSSNNYDLVYLIIIQTKLKFPLDFTRFSQNLKHLAYKYNSY